MDSSEGLLRSRLVHPSPSAKFKLKEVTAKRPLTAPDKQNYPSDPLGINLKGGTQSHVHGDAQFIQQIITH